MAQTTLVRQGQGHGSGVEGRQLETLQSQYIPRFFLRIGVYKNILHPDNSITYFNQFIWFIAEETENCVTVWCNPIHILVIKHDFTTWCTYMHTICLQDNAYTKDPDLVTYNSNMITRNQTQADSLTLCHSIHLIPGILY